MSKELLDYETIVAAVAGETEAKERVIAHYADYIDELSMVEVRQLDGRVKKEVDEYLRQEIILKLLEEISNFQIGQE